LEFHVTERADDDYDYAPSAQPRSRVLFWIIVIIVLAGTGVGSAFLWQAYGNGLSVFRTGTATPEPTPPDKPVGLADFQAFQQQIVGSMQSTEQVLAAQEAEIKRLSDEVAALSAKLDLVQHPVAPAEALAPGPASKPVAPPPRKKPAAPKPAGAISTGGAPLPAQSTH
jgi:uncharacterized coiled-coil protein SlyX